ARSRNKEPKTIAAAMASVIAPALICALLLVIAFIPLLVLQRVEGRIFRPLGITLVAGLAGGQLAALIFVPAFSNLYPHDGGTPGPIDRLSGGLARRCRIVAAGIAKVPAASLVVLLILGGSGAWLAAGIGREFLPSLNEGALWIRVLAPPTISREAAV